MKVKRLGQLAGLLLVLAVALGLLTVVQVRMHAISQEEGLTVETPLEDVHPTLALTAVALGSFRGLVADVLFLRARQMQDDGNYFELVQLGTWLVKLQPRFTAATAFLAWNMAYNVSVKFNDHRDRWRWVQRGIELIRDDALPLNPGDPVLYKELGWIYQNKLGNILDDAHRLYKGQLAMQMIHVLGNHDRFDWERLAAAPNDPEELKTKLEADRRWAALQRVLGDAKLTLFQLEDNFRATGNFTPEMAEALKAAGLFDTLDFYLRSRWLRDSKKLDCEEIWKIVQHRGPLDFRLPEAHAIYWATLGLERTPTGTNVDCQRMISQSMANAFKGGRLLYLPANGIPIVGPNLEIVDQAREAYLEAMEGNPNIRSFKGGYENWLKDAIVQLYAGGRRDKAMEYLGLLRADYTRPEYKWNIDRFALHEMAGDIAAGDLKQTESLVDLFIGNALLELAAGNGERAEAVEAIARRIYDRYQDQKKNMAGRMGLRPFADYKRRKALELTYSPRGLPPALAENLRRLLDLPPPEEAAKEFGAGNLLRDAAPEDLPLQNP